MNPLDTVADLLMLAREGSYTAAALRLGVPRSTVSRRISRLEESVGQRLVDRTTRSLRLTDAGLELVARCRGPIDELGAAFDAVRQAGDVPRGPLRVALPPGLGRGFWGEFLIGFKQRYPLVQVIATHTTDRMHLLEDDFDVILQEDPPEHDAWISRIISPADRFLVASSEYIRDHGMPRAPAELCDHACLAYSSRPSARVEWPLRSGGTLGVSPAFCTNDQSMVLDIALAHGGIALLSMVSTSVDLLEGRLVPVLAGDVGASATLVALYAARSHTVPKVDALLTYMEQVVRQTAEDMQGPEPRQTAEPISPISFHRRLGRE